MSEYRTTLDVALGTATTKRAAFQWRTDTEIVHGWLTCKRMYLRRLHGDDHTIGDG